LRKKAFFAVFLAFFVLCGGGRSGDWVIICRDKGGWTYEAELTSLKGEPNGQVSCLVRTHKGGHSQQALWTLDKSQNSLRVGDGPAEKIRSGSVASSIFRFLEARAARDSREKDRAG
jgi:hypothetical protein